MLGAALRLCTSLWAGLRWLRHMLRNAVRPTLLRFVRPKLRQMRL